MGDRSFFPLHSDSRASRAHIPNCFDAAMVRNSFQRVPNQLHSLRNYKHVESSGHTRPQWPAWNTHPLSCVDSMSYANLYQPSQSGFYNAFPSTHTQLKVCENFSQVTYPEQYRLQRQNFPVQSTHPTDGISRFSFPGGPHQRATGTVTPLQIETFKDQEESRKLCTVCNLIFSRSKDYVTHLQLESHDKLCCARCKLVLSETVDYLDHILICGNNA